VVICLLCVEISMAERDNRTTCLSIRRWLGSSSRKKCSRIDDKRNLDTNYRIENRCLRTNDRIYAKIDCKVNMSI
jgi:hypothetical protein